MLAGSIASSPAPRAGRVTCAAADATRRWLLQGAPAATSSAAGSTIAWPPISRLPPAIRRCSQGEPMNEKIFPRNLTARAAVSITGNPVTTRLESGVGNCFPGLEFDHRNLDRRFFPGLVFNFGIEPPVLDTIDDGDPALAEQLPADAPQLSAAVTRAFDRLGTGEWLLTSLAQGGRTIDLQALADSQQFDPATFWRFVRSLTRDKVTIVLTQSPAAAAPNDDASPTAPAR